MISIGHFGARGDAIIKIRQFFEEKRALEVVEVIEVAEAAEVNEAVKVSKAVKITPSEYLDLIIQCKISLNFDVANKKMLIEKVTLGIQRLNIFWLLKLGLKEILICVLNNITNVHTILTNCRHF